VWKITKKGKTSFVCYVAKSGRFVHYLQSELVDSKKTTPYAVKSGGHVAKYDWPCDVSPANQNSPRIL
jgi:hypothetical protein